MAEDQSQLIANLAAHEEAIGALYEIFAQKFPENRDLWAGLTSQEKEHARWLRRLNKRITDDKDFGRVLTERFPPQDLEDSLKKLKLLADKTHQDEFTPQQALQIALNVEQSLLEQKYFEVFEGESAEINQVLYLLEEQTKEHANRIRSFLKPRD